MVSIAKLTCALSLLSLIGSAVAHGQARVWQDPSGLYQVEGVLVTADDSLVVIKKSSGELVVLRQEQLSQADRDYLASQRGTSSATVEAEPSSSPPPVSPPTERPPAPRVALPPVAEGVVETLPTELSTWYLRNGKLVEGVLVGFGRQEFVVLRRDGQLWINGVNLEQLPAAYKLIVPAVVSRVDAKPLANISELERHIAAGGGGPFQYIVEGIQLELAGGGVITIPLALLESQLLSLVETGFARWKAAQGEGVTEEDRYATSARERLFLDTYERLRRTEAAKARELKLMELGLLSVDAGLTEIWEVALLPSNPYAFPRSVVVPGRDSLDAQQIAAQAYPGWQIGPVRKLSN